MLTQGYASTVLAPVSDSNRDASGTYDGEWMAVVQSTTSVQYGPGNWQISCDDQTGEEYGPFLVSNGKASFGSRADANINTKGKFRVRVPLDTKTAASGTSDSTLASGDMSLIMFGSLAKGTGSLTFGIRELSDFGCTSKVKYKRV